MVLRSKTPELVKQEFFGLLLAHYAVRKLMHEAALKAGPGCGLCLSFPPAHGPRGPSQAGRCSSLPPPADRPALYEAVLDEILDQPVDSSRGRRNPRRVKRKMSSYPLQRGKPRLPPIPDPLPITIKIVK